MGCNIKQYIKGDNIYIYNNKTKEKYDYLIENLYNESQKVNSNANNYMAILLGYASNFPDISYDRHGYNIFCQDKHTGKYFNLFGFVSNEELDISSFIGIIVKGINHYNRVHNKQYKVVVYVGFTKGVNLKAYNSCKCKLCF